jgi:hypothetical protein
MHRNVRWGFPVREPPNPVAEWAGDFHHGDGKARRAGARCKKSEGSRRKDEVMQVSLLPVLVLYGRLVARGRGECIEEEQGDTKANVQ